MGRKKKVEEPKVITRDDVAAFVLAKAGHICNADRPIREEEKCLDWMDSLDSVEVIMACEVEYQKCIPESKTSRWDWDKEHYSFKDFINDIWGVVGDAKG